MIVGIRAKGGSISERAKFVNCSRGIYRAWQNGTVQNQRHGKWGTIDDSGERRLWRYGRANGPANVEQLTAQMNEGATKSVSQTTVQRTLLRRCL
ncbi:transposable element Tcb1 transposase [Trichonephila clavipes]|nr:transposable element Tcb1 transposase [Trichonephila clavipes]